MGAYENIEPLNFNTSSAGAAWANAAAQAGAMLGKAIEERSKLDLLELEKNNKKALDVLKSQQNAASRIQQKTEELQKSKEFKGLDVRLQEKVIEDHKILFDLENKRDLALTTEDFNKYSEEYNKQQKITKSSLSSLLNINEGVQELTANLVGYTDEQTLYLPGTIDVQDDENTNLAIAGQILNGMNNYKGDYTIGTDKDGSYVLNFNYSLKGEPQEKITLSAAEISNWKAKKIPNIEAMTMDLLTKQGVFEVDGKLADKYFIKDEKGIIAKELITQKVKDNKGKFFDKTTEVPRIDEDALKKAYLSAVESLPLDTWQKKSAFNNIYKKQVPSTKEYNTMDYTKIDINTDEYLAGAGGYSAVLYNNALQTILTENSTKPTFEPVPTKDKNNPKNAKTMQENVLDAFNTKEGYISEGGKYMLEFTEALPTVDPKKTESADTAGWFKDGENYFRVLQKDAQGVMTPFEKIKNRKQALQFFGASVVLPGG
jgi:hypothetical protein